MNQDNLKDLLNQVAQGSLSVENAKKQLTHISFENIDFAQIDHHRSLRKGFPEVIFGQGKTSEQIIGIMEKMIIHEEIILVTRLEPEKAQKIKAVFQMAEYFEDANFLWLKKNDPEITGIGKILVISAGTSDIPVAKEAFLTAQAMGNEIGSIFDVGVAGIHRLFAYQEQIINASVIIVVAGMEGALPSVVAGMVKAPVIAVPTSIGYGTSFNGMTALLGMLNSCSSNIAVVNIDNGFGAGYMASSINHVS
ncbi:MAG: nickel pincer cofactor biosynthesis protein LarB [Desulfobacula sp.]|jgi:pyridinium-3,5-biscarboxylic acid mononucleotide synthase|uniref:nickel pincer cofactor biosynthesis protein LarB n=1 Tax=Desulfobacula sp. TaxID=2593537 RepID=UPI001E146E79|nr:nickel pincer cofactor biosynthesis protein LarB [Desulfobacula sp.]MBT3487817.1 nickel pincer cofactor biosynthesis protein LarB [Desulfobacula sp.]MBT3806370.1 nickel pincer cofactor biosynthesis protein LarB [Desulfobacula sp.]MBT4025913.1 nickel pincer cofactor biosynthesis protein LarB [Desulfobacula sp.]MBT4199141.1 nickel pincer cofactor biosynthesis protein LarB [Desulfobacula sp.]